MASLMGVFFPKHSAKSIGREHFKAMPDGGITEQKRLVKIAKLSRRLSHPAHRMDRKLALKVERLVGGLE